MSQQDYVHGDVLVSTDWVAQYLDDPNVRLAESNEDVLLYSTGHIPGAINIDWQQDLNDALVRDYIDAEAFAALLARHGITPETTVVLYGDKNTMGNLFFLGLSALWPYQCQDSQRRSRQMDR